MSGGTKKKAYNKEQINTPSSEKGEACVGGKGDVNRKLGKVESKGGLSKRGKQEDENHE